MPESSASALLLPVRPASPRERRELPLPHAHPRRDAVRSPPARRGRGASLAAAVTAATCVTADILYTHAVAQKTRAHAQPPPGAGLVARGGGGGGALWRAATASLPRLSRGTLRLCSKGGRAEARGALPPPANSARAGTCGAARAKIVASSPGGQPRNAAPRLQTTVDAVLRATQHTRPTAARSARGARCHWHRCDGEGRRRRCRSA